MRCGESIFNDYIALRDGTLMPRLGQGTWQMGEDDEKAEDEIRGLLYGLELGFDMIDTAEMYADGKAELLVGKALQLYADGKAELLVGKALQKWDLLQRSEFPQNENRLQCVNISQYENLNEYSCRESEGQNAVYPEEAADNSSSRPFLVTKVYPENANRRRICSSLDRSLKLMGADAADLYLLHWRGDADLSEMVCCMEELKAQGRIKNWGVSNFDVQDMEDLWKVPDGHRCAVNQILYNLGTRGIEYDLLEWQRAHHVPMMAYSPVGQAGALVTQDNVSKARLMQDANVRAVAKRHGASVVQILLAFVLRLPDMAAIPKAVQPQHIRENYEARNIILTQEDLEQLSSSFPAPTKKIPMEKY